MSPQKHALANDSHASLLAGMNARVVAVHAAAMLHPLFHGRAVSFDTLRDDCDRLPKDAIDSIGVLREGYEGMGLAWVQWHASVQCCDAQGRVLREGSDAVYVVWYVAAIIIISIIIIIISIIIVIII